MPYKTKYLHFFRALEKSAPKERKRLLQSNAINDDILKQIGEIIYNVLDGNAPLTPIQKNRLQKYKQSLRAYNDALTSRKRRKILYNDSSFLPFLLKAFL